MAAKRRKQKQTLKEFRAWLEGVEELQPDNWAPNREQWKLIRARIDGIILEEKIIEKQNQHVPPTPVQPAPPTVPPVAAVAGLPPPPPTPSSIPAGDVVMTPEARQMLNPGASGKIKTPDIDTSDGKVESPFA